VAVRDGRPVEDVEQLRFLVGDMGASHGHQRGSRVELRTPCCPARLRVASLVTVCPAPWLSEFRETRSAGSIRVLIRRLPSSTCPPVRLLPWGAIPPSRRCTLPEQRSRLLCALGTRPGPVVVQTPRSPRTPRHERRLVSRARAYAPIDAVTFANQ
jgi:hypothetical protein